MTEVYLSPAVTGRLSTLDVHEGDPVKKGQLLGTLDRFDQTRRDWERLKSLRASGEAARQQVEHAELAYQDQQLISPLNGVILIRVGEPGEGMSPGVPAVVIGDPQDVWMKLYISEGDIGRVFLGQKAAVTIDSFPGRSFKGRVTFISPKAEFTPKNVQTKEERVNQTFAVKVTLTEPSGILKAGMPADCDLD